MNQPRVSIRTKIEWFYERNPDEELSYKQIMLKFNCSLKTARNAVYELQEMGVLESTHVVRRRAKGLAQEA